MHLNGTNESSSLRIRKAVEHRRAVESGSPFDVGNISLCVIFVGWSIAFQRAVTRHPFRDSKISILRRKQLIGLGSSPRIGTIEDCKPPTLGVVMPDLLVRCISQIARIVIPPCQRPTLPDLQRMIRASDIDGPAVVVGPGIWRPHRVWIVETSLAKIHASAIRQSQGLHRPQWERMAIPVPHSVPLAKLF